MTQHPRTHPRPPPPKELCLNDCRRESSGGRWRYRGPGCTSTVLKNEAGMDLCLCELADLRACPCFVHCFSSTQPNVDNKYLTYDHGCSYLFERCVDGRITKGEKHRIPPALSLRKVNICRNNLNFQQLFQWNICWLIDGLRVMD